MRLVVAYLKGEREIVETGFRTEETWFVRKVFRQEFQGEFFKPGQRNYPVPKGNIEMSILEPEEFYLVSIGMEACPSPIDPMCKRG